MFINRQRSQYYCQKQISEKKKPEKFWYVFVHQGRYWTMSSAKWRTQPPEIRYGKPGDKFRLKNMAL